MEDNFFDDFRIIYNYKNENIINLMKLLDKKIVKTQFKDIFKKNINSFKLETFKTSLSDDVWKAGAKETLFTAFTTLDSEVYQEILSKLETAYSIADKVDEYNTARDKANAYRDNLNSATDKTPQSSISSWQSGLAAEERKMEQCESAINGLL